MNSACYIIQVTGAVTHKIEEKNRKLKSKEKINFRNA